MPVARFQMPDGRVARFEVPEGTTPEAAQAMIEQSLSASAAKPAQDNTPPRPAVNAEAKGRADAGKPALFGLTTRGAVANAAQGPLFGFGDEIAGGIAAAVGGVKNALSVDDGSTYSQRYAAYRDYLRGQVDKQKEDNPISSAVASGVASIPSLAITAPAGAAVKGVGMGANALRAALTGGASGVLSGAGNSRADTLAGVAGDAVKQGAVDAALGGVSQPVVAGIGKVLGTGVAAVSNTKAGQYAREKVAEAFARDAAARGTMQDTNAIGQALARMNTLGPEARAVDAGGQNAKALLDLTATLPGATKTSAATAIRERLSTRGDRLITSADSALGANGARAASTVDELLAKRSGDAAPLYDKLYKRGVFIDDNLRGIISAADQLGAGGAAKKVAIASQRDYGLSPETNWSGMRELDYLKQGLDDIIASNKNDYGQLTKVGAAVQGLKAQLVATLDEKTGGLYKQARDAYAGPSAIADAVTQGRKAMSQDDMTIKSALAGMSQSEAEGFRIGAFEALRAKLGTKGGQYSIMDMYREPAVQDKLKAMFGDERSYRQFASSISAEARMKGLESVGAGSQTAARAFAAGDVDSPALGAAAGLAKGLASGSPSGIMAAAGDAWNRVKTPEPVRNEIGRLLLSRDPNDLAQLDMIARLIGSQRAASAVRVGKAAGATGNAFSQLIQ